MKELFERPLEERLQEFIHYTELKQLAYNLAAMQQEKGFHSLAVLSFFPSEGKTLFCAAMALAYAETVRTKVLLVDTTTFQNKNSIVLRECFNGKGPDVRIMTLDELRQGVPGSARPASREKGPIFEAEIVRERTATNMPAPRENDFSLIKKAAEDHNKQYGLVLLDTAPLEAKNRSNIDPLLVARLSDASVLIVSRKLLNAPKLNASLKVLEDPTLHLLGMISNETHAPS